MGSRRAVAAALASLLRVAPFVAIFAAGCAHAPVEKVPGETDIAFTRVTIVPKAGSVDVDFGPLYGKLGSRAATALFTARKYNPFLSLIHI